MALHILDPPKANAGIRLNPVTAPSRHCAPPFGSAFLLDKRSGKCYLSPNGDWSALTRPIRQMRWKTGPHPVTPRDPALVYQTTAGFSFLEAVNYIAESHNPRNAHESCRQIPWERVLTTRSLLFGSSIMADFVKALEAEIEKLESELSEDSRFVLYRDLMRVRNLYAIPKDSNAGKSVGRLREGKPSSGRRQSPERAKALDAARIYLANRAGPTTTREIYEHLEGIGIELPGENPQNNLSAMLSNSDMFESHGRSGWTLASASSGKEFSFRTDKAGPPSSLIPPPAPKPIDPRPPSVKVYGVVPPKKDDGDPPF